ncbi:DUF2628 domain-containing protein [Stenotrophomonas sp. PD6]|uniref:DUF2628 domain-containing protein n=1 Tax=Stenotrophomonas sp. PD6 TaxID=3368612 RepID=UPI003BA34586
METPSYSNYPQKWRDRFQFFDAHGAPGSLSYKAAFKALPFLRRIRIQSSILAFLFGPIYFFILGLWRKALVGLALSLGTIIVAVLLYAIFGANSAFADIVSRVLGLAMTLIYATTANYAYYLKEVKGADSWNIFEGLRL